MNKRGTEDRLIDISAPEFRDRIGEIDPSIDPERFLLMARIIAGKKFEELPSNASFAKEEARKRNIDTEVSAAITYDLKSLVRQYHSMQVVSVVSCEEIHHAHFLEKEQEYALSEGFDPIEPLADIDKPSQNGMTRLGDTIARSDNVEEVRRLIEICGASPAVRCGEFTPLELAEELGRPKILAYLREIADLMI